jgi:lysophospholipase L1-like esterase
LGDSFTFGDHVNTNDSWPEQVEDLLNNNPPCKKYNKYEVLNLGLRGFDIQDEIERYRIRGSKYNPDLVLWLLIWNDFDEINELIPDVTQQVMQEQKENPNIVSLTDTKTYKSVLEHFQTTYPIDKRSALLTQYMSDFYTSYKGPVVLSTFTNLDEKFKDLMRSWSNTGSSRYFFDQLPDLYTDSTLNLLDGHPSVTGHKRIAESLLNYIQSKSLLSCD